MRIAEQRHAPNDDVAARNADHFHIVQGPEAPVAPRKVNSHVVKVDEDAAAKLHRMLAHRNADDPPAAVCLGLRHRPPKRTDRVYVVAVVPDLVDGLSKSARGPGLQGKAPHFGKVRRLIKALLPSAREGLRRLGKRKRRTLKEQFFGGDRLRGADQRKAGRCGEIAPQRAVRRPCIGQIIHLHPGAVAHPDGIGIRRRIDWRAKAVVDDIPRSDGKRLRGRDRQCFIPIAGNRIHLRVFVRLANVDLAAIEREAVRPAVIGALIDDGAGHAITPWRRASEDTRRPLADKPRTGLPDGWLLL